MLLSGVEEGAVFTQCSHFLIITYYIILTDEISSRGLFVAANK